MAQTDAIINVKVVGQAALTGLENAIQKVQKRFGGLQAAVAGLGLAVLARTAFIAADDMADLSNATGITVERILELQFALSAAGGRFDQLSPAVVRFSQTLGEAYDGSLKAQRALDKVGVSLQDLRTLSEEELLAKTIKGLGAIDNVSIRSAYAVDIFGKAVKGVALDQLANEIDKSKGKYKDYSDAVQKAAQLQQNLELTLLKVRTIVLEAVQPFVSFANAMLSTAESTKTLADTIDILMNVLLIFAGGALFRGIAAVFGSIMRGVEGISKWIKVSKEAKKATDGLTQSWNGNSYKMNAVRTGLTLVGATAAGVGGAIVELDGETLDYNNTLDQTKEKLPTVAQVTDIYTASIQGLQLALKNGKITLQQFQEEVTKADKARKDMLSKIQPTEKPVDTSELDKQLNAIKEVTQSYDDQVRAQLLSASRKIQQIGLTTEEKAAMDAFNETIDNATKAILELENRKKDLTAQDTEQLAEINKQQKAIRDRMLLDAEAASNAEANNARQSRSIQLLIEDIDLLNNIMAEESGLNALQRQVELIGLVGDELEDANLQLQYEIGLQTRLEEIEAKRRRAKVELQGSELTEYLDRLQREEDAARASAERKLGIERNLLEQTRALRGDIGFAIQQKMEEMARSIDPATVALDSLNSVLANVGNAIDEFSKTGKLNFKDFALAVIADLLKVQIQLIVTRALMAAIGAISGSFAPSAAVGSSVSPIPGVGFAATGAKPLAGQPFVVGEQGPELFIPKTAGTIVPNDRMNGGPVNAPVTNVVNNYNINAVDAKSVAQLFAENRKSLLGAVGMAQKEMPYMMGG